MLLLTGCGGGGGGSAATQTTVIDGFNLTEGTADAKKGATYAQEFLTEVSAQNTTVDDLYTRLNVSGVEQAHIDGWTGKGKTITVLDGTFNTGDHGRLVSDIARTIAPGATRNEYNYATLSSSQNITTMASDVITTSSGFYPSALVAYPSLVSYEANLINSMESSNALVTVAAQHSNWVGGTHAQLTTCPNPNSGTMTVANCNTWALKGLNASNVIYVGEIDANDNIPLTSSLSSNQAGETHKNQFIVTSSDYVTTSSDGGAHGNSFSAPRVAGAGALVRHKFPNLSGAQTATTILHTADDLGATGVDAVYGHGKLNVGKALAPVGNLH